MNTTELKALAEKATPGPWIAALESAQDERRALLATEQNLMERVKALEEGLKRLLSSHIDYTESQHRGWPKNKKGYPNYEWSMEIESEARALLEKTT